MDIEFLFGNSGDGLTTLRKSFCHVLIEHFKMVKVLNLMSYIFYHNC